MIKRKENNKDFPGGPVAEAPGSQCRGPRFHPRSGNPHATTKSLQAVTKDATCRNKDWRSTTWSATTKTQGSQMNKYYK